jgi:IS30 family transposase
MPKLISPETRSEFLGLVCAGSSLRAAAGAVGVSHGAGQKWWRESGSMEFVVVPGARGGLARDGSGVGSRAARREGRLEGRARSRKPLTAEDRAVIAAGQRSGLSYARIGALIGRDKSVVCREVARNRGTDGSYFGPVAHHLAGRRSRRPKQFKLAVNRELCARIETWMDQGWSPGLIAAMLKAEHGPYTASNRMQRVSHETIYQALYVQTRGRLRADLHRQLSLRRPRRKPRTTPRPRSKIYDDAFKISDRPAEVADRAVPGHWEGDLILGTANGSAVGTLVERTTRFTILLHLPDRHDADSVAAAMIQEMRKLPEHLRRSITWDRGTELARYEQITSALQAPVYFCDPHSPWQRGSNENTNRLLRFWLEKGTDLSTHTAADLRRIADTLNKRPRPTLDLQTPADRLNQLITQVA